MIFGLFRALDSVPALSAYHPIAVLAHEDSGAAVRTLGSLPDKLSVLAGVRRVLRIWIGSLSHQLSPSSDVSFSSES